MYAAMREGGNLAGFAIGKELLASFFSLLLPVASISRPDIEGLHGSGTTLLCRRSRLDG